MSRLIRLCLLLVALSGCQLMSIPPWGWDYPGFPHPETFSSVQDVVGWTSQNLTWKYEGIHWNTPDETYDTRTGDCKAYALLAMYFLHEAGIDSELVILDPPDSAPPGSDRHAIVKIVSTGKLVDPQAWDGRLWWYVGQFKIESEISYEDAEWIAYRMK